MEDNYSHKLQSSSGNSCDYGTVTHQSDNRSKNTPYVIGIILFAFIAIFTLFSFSNEPDIFILYGFASKNSSLQKNFSVFLNDSEVGKGVFIGTHNFLKKYEIIIYKEDTWDKIRLGIFFVEKDNTIYIDTSRVTPESVLLPSNSEVFITQPKYIDIGGGIMVSRLWFKVWVPLGLAFFVLLCIAKKLLNLNKFFYENWD